MRILFISHRLYPCIVGGAEIFNYYLLRELSKKCNLSVVTACGGQDKMNADIIEVDPKKFGTAKLGLPLQDLYHIYKMRKHIDLVHVSSYMRSFWLQWIPYPLMKKIFGVPYIVTIHGGGMQEWKPKFPHTFLFHNAHAITGISQRIKAEYEKRSGRNVEFIPPLIPFESFQGDRSRVRDMYGLGEHDTLLLAVGSIKKIKGSDILLKAFFALGKDYIAQRKLKLLFAGDGDMREGLEKMVAENGFSGHVFFLGNIPRDKVPSLYAVADIYMMPSLFEGTPISMLEAMFNRVPVIAADSPGINSIISSGRNGILFESQNTLKLKTSMMTLIEDPDSARKLAEQAREDFDEKYDFTRTAQEYLKIYEEAVKKCSV